MNTKTALIGLVVVVLLGGGYYVYSSQKVTTIAPSANLTTTPSSGMRVEDNAIVAQDQKLGKAVLVAQVYLAAPGYVVIHDASEKVLGSSALLPAGQNDNVMVQLSRTTKEGEMLHAMLHNELNNNTIFEENTDSAVQSKLGGPIMGMFNITSQASTNTPVSL